MAETKTSKVQCADCKETFDFDDDGSVDCMPDGCFLNGLWYCDECIRDNEGNLKPEFA